MANLSKEEIDSEIEKCKNSVSYFYNNYCRKEGMPEYSEEAFQEYIKEAEKARLRNGYNRRGKVMLTREFPLTPNECMIKSKEDKKEEILKMFVDTPKGKMWFDVEAWQKEQNFKNLKK